MNPFREIPPTAGWPINTASLAKRIFNQYPEKGLEKEFQGYLGAPLALLTYSGTAAFYLILKSLQKLSGKKTVIIPAFVCPLIPLAIARAGLQVMPCDINPDNFDFDLQALEKICAQNKDVLAILAVHLGGIPVELGGILEIAKRKKIFVIEDCAQSLGAEYRGKKTGSWGDFSFFSLCRGKGLTIYEGGLAVTNRAEYAGLLDTCANQLMPENGLSEALKIFELFGYSLFYRPQLFWFVFRLPQIYWQIRKNPLKAMGEYFDTGFPLHKVSRFRAGAGYAAFSRIDDNIRMQREKTALYVNGLKNIPAVKPVLEPSGATASYPYLGLIFADAAKRNTALNIFRNSGLGVSLIYLHAITDYPYLQGIVPDKDCPRARDLAEKSLTLSTSIFLNHNDLSNIVKKLERIS